MCDVKDEHSRKPGMHAVPPTTFMSSLTSDFTQNTYILDF
jgi:hypothetical protein